MFSTAVVAAVFGGLLLASAALWALFLRLGLRWAKVPAVTMRRVVLTTAIVIVLQTALNVLFLLAARAFIAQSVVLSLVELVAAVVIPCAVISALFKTRLLRAFQAWLPTLLASVATVAFIILVLRPYLYEAFFTPTNAMAPTLLGQHRQGTCPECGARNYGSPRDDRFGAFAPVLMICDNFHVTQSSDVDKHVHVGSRFLVAKFLNPRRWDIVVFQYPEDPSLLYVKRLVAFPGEKVHIEDGALWIDGEQQTPPESLAGIEYLQEIPDWFGPDLWGSANRPALLGEDEYFVLGDFSAQSMDSRFWRAGAPGHNPFAVPEAHLKGVVTHTFWPPRRWRIHR